MECGLYSKMRLEKKKIAFVYSRIQLNDAPLQYMPFGLNAVKMLDSMGCEVDLFLSEKENKSYSDLFSKRVNIYFLDNKTLWSQGYGRKHFFLLTNYFKWLIAIQRKKYDTVFGIGIAGNTLASFLAEKNKCFFIAMNDEFPDVYHAEKWRLEEKKSISRSDIIIVPDESRFEELCVEIPGINKKKWAELPNGPLASDIINIPRVNWNEYFNIPDNSFPFLFTGDTGPVFMLYDIMLTLPGWPENAVLIINHPEKRVKKVMNHLVLSGKVIFNEKKLPEPEFHSLIQFCTASFGMYRTDIFKLNYIGKSSGKIMRSVACSRPVIAPKVPSLKFIEEKGLGVLVSHPMEIPQAIAKITSGNSFNASCKEEFSRSLHYEKYWESFLQSLNNLA